MQIKRLAFVRGVLPFVATAVRGSLFVVAAVWVTSRPITTIAPPPPERRNTPSAIPTYVGWALIVVRAALPSVAAAWARPLGQTAVRRIAFRMMESPEALPSSVTRCRPRPLGQSPHRPDPPEHRNTPSAMPIYVGWALIVVRTALPSVAAAWATSSRPITTIAPTLPNVGIRLGYANLRWLGIDCGSYGASVGCRGMGHILSANHHHCPDPP